MAKGKWVMTPARQAYYASKKKGGKKTKSVGKGSGKGSKEFSHAFKVQFKMQMRNQRDLYAAQGKQWNASRARRNAARWALMGVNPRSSKAIAKYAKVGKRLFKKK